jgi:fatty acid desaturase
LRDGSDRSRLALRAYCQLEKGKEMERERGEEFRDDLRGVDPTRALSEVRRLLPPPVLAELTRLDAWRASYSVAQTMVITALAIAVAWTHFEWWLVVPAVLLIGTQQHAMFVLAHDAAHYRLFEMRWLNELFGRLFGALGAIPVGSYRVIHRLHHNNLYGEVDPDIALHGGYPRGKAYLVRKLLQDLAGINAWKTIAYFFGNPAINAATNRAQRPLDDTSPALRAAARRDRLTVAAFHVAVPVVLLIIGGPVALGKYVVLWIVPLLSVLQPILRLRAICEHGAVTDFSTPLTAARTNVVGPFARLVLFPHHVNYHVEHHLFPAVPHYHLPRLHHELAQRGIIARAEIRPLADTLRRVFAPRGSLQTTN